MCIVAGWMGGRWYDYCGWMEGGSVVCVWWLDGGEVGGMVVDMVYGWLD